MSCQVKVMVVRNKMKCPCANGSRQVVNWMSIQSSSNDSAIIRIGLAEADGARRNAHRLEIGF